MWNVGLWLRYNVYEEDNLYNVVSTMLEQHCVRILFSQCCPNTSETTLHKKCWLKMHRYTFAGKPAVSNMSDSLFLTGYYITEQSGVFLFNVGSEVYFWIAGQQWTGNKDWTLTGTKWWNAILVNFKKSFVIVNGKYSKI